MKEIQRRTLKLLYGSLYDPFHGGLAGSTVKGLELERTFTMVTRFIHLLYRNSVLNMILKVVVQNRS